MFVLLLYTNNALTVVFSETIEVLGVSFGIYV